MYPQKPQNITSAIPVISFATLFSSAAVLILPIKKSADFKKILIVQTFDVPDSIVGKRRVYVEYPAKRFRQRRNTAIMRRRNHVRSAANRPLHFLAVSFGKFVRNNHIRS